MEASTAAVVVVPTTGTPPKHMLALAKAQRRVREVAAFKRDIREGRLTAADALNDPRAVGAITVGQVLIAQRGWGERTSIAFLLDLGASETVMVKRVESLTERQRGVLARALAEPVTTERRRDWW